MRTDVRKDGAAAFENIPAAAAAASSKNVWMAEPS